MELTLKLNARFQPKHRFELEDAIQEILEKKQIGEVTGGGTTQDSNGEIVCCDIEIYLKDDEKINVKWLINLLNKIGIPRGSELLGGTCIYCLILLWNFIY